MELLLLGLLAGILTTVAGMGGGILLLAALSLLRDPREALAITAPALFVGNLHRAVLFRHKIDRKVALPFSLGALPGSLVGALLVVALPLWVLKVLLVVMVGLALGRSLGWWRWTPSSRVIVPAAAGVGLVSATAGGAGLLLSPLLMSTGLTGDAYIATVALCAVALHLGRIVGYGAGGMLTAQTLSLGAGLTVAILAGNLVGARIRKRLPSSASVPIELTVLVVSAALCLAGVTR